MTRGPNLFIVGAPKCGTTALHQYLHEHPAVFMSHPKEPAYWCTDFPDAVRGTFVPLRCEQDYLSIFKAAQPGHHWIGESSTYYLYSKTAVPNILKFNSDARIIAAVRNPIDLVVSLHSQMLFGFGEDVKSFEDAWALQDRRRNGERIPPGCYVPEMLQYREVGRLGEQIQRLFEIVPEKQRLVIVFDDFVRNPEDVYRGILRFLDLPDDGRRMFGRINEKRKHRFPLISNLIRKPPGPLRPVMNFIRNASSGRGPRLLGVLKSAMTRTGEPPQISAAMRKELIGCFADDVARLSDLLSRDLSHWISGKPAGGLSGGHSGNS